MTIALRRATPDDSALLLDWVNRPDSLAGKLLTTGPIDRDRHEAWFAARLADPDTFLWVIESDQKPVGQLRLMHKADAYELDIYVTSSQRSIGVARRALAAGIRALSRERPGGQLVRARVKVGNISSQRLFQRAGFVLSTRSSDHLVYDLITS
jgi:RimJ/RimL family protein N-acetyltransferase